MIDVLRFMSQGRIEDALRLHTNALGMLVDHFRLCVHSWITEVRGSRRERRRFHKSTFCLSGFN